ncbi:hypothetical protein PTSG_11195 [Salpingoeca rosetta]|uniref:Uncharacterized protein n=1 Tax=Salpingoeca rosetta (strain ATCC 50818 / BSB-021) TaxID=946362 RepID=F2USP6_SALR5|nr:uncharacterized protein PTSG_11195 [Salpingoeca rosetta]EGD81155.1 hypothetical protein PTSG_11195 [Salpingoeca rosetta]|eukprot:XP_004987840.1 hypothetical protein PTSG_11195 [Salpingoeca rosetta]
MPRPPDVLKAARANDWRRLLDIVTGKKESRLRSTIRRKRKPAGDGASNATTLVLDKNDDGSLQVKPCAPGVRIDLRDDTGSTPLILAALGGNVEAASCLIAYGANVDAQDTDGNTALHMAAWQEREHSVDVMELLLKNGADPNIANAENRTPLHNAVQNGQTFAVMVLLDHNADVHVRNDAGETPLDIAVRFGREEVVSVLLNHDISVTKSTRALREAAQMGRASLVRTLLDMGMDVAAEDPETRDTALHVAVKFSRTSAVETLLAFGADPYQPNAAGKSAHDAMLDLSDERTRDVMLALVEEYKDKDVQLPAIVLNERRQRKAKQAIGDYQSTKQATSSEAHDPVIRVLARWCEDTAQWRSTAHPDWPVTHLLSEDPSAEWRAASIGPQWTAFKFPNLYTITGIDLVARPGPHVPRDVQLQVADGLEGPWRAVASFKMQSQPGPGVQLDMVTHTMTQHFSGFHATSQYWRLNILRAHGSVACALSHVRFYGFDAVMPKWFAEHGMTEYLQPFIDAGLNQLKELTMADRDKYAKIIQLPGHLKKFELAVLDLKGEKRGFDRLVFSRPPPATAVAGQALPMFEVQANAGADQEVELVVHGNAHVTGTMRARLLPNGSHPSIAFFDDIVLAPPGQYMLEVRSVTDPTRVYVKSPHPITVEAPPRKRSAMEVLFADYSPMLAF